ncbi:hypothetical protein [Argonema antarcticum]|uniref:ATPase, T2SS/T4P/T4SS family n=1 Tax=Argonema antarcticum TaxID=2942763 RepID=UPI002011ADBB|nr:hypothetical protein [Argonema antarcticum]MCL1470987.1 hypothetical protein [Argonema antarcticum A004/B2]
MAPLASNLLKLKQSSDRQAFFSPQPDKGMEQANYDVTFRLIDGILPFEACLYHQVLPISLEGTHLNLGMVNPDDSAALDYVRRILAYMNCSLVPQPISAAKHQAVLSAYLNHIGQLKQATAKQQNTPSENKFDQNTQATLIVDSPEDLNQQELESSSSQVTAPPTTSSHSYTPSPQPPKATPEKQKPNTKSPKPPTPASGVGLPVLEVQAHHISSPVEVLATLTPKNLLQELLARILAGGIGRLFFERHPNSGRILWSQNGVLQSVLEGLDTAVFQGVINELKLLTHLSLISVEHPKQVEIERIYQQHRLLLRLRVMPGTHGEEATLQVLRGAALKFYQQQQLENLSRDALTMAQQLQTKINEIQKRTRIDPTLTAGQLDALPALDELLKSLNQQLETLKLLQVEMNSDDNVTS